MTVLVNRRFTLHDAPVGSFRDHRCRAEGIADLFARAPFEEGGWDAALKALADATGSTRSQLLALGERHAAFNWVTDAEGIPDYFDEFLAIDGFNPQVNYRVAATRMPFEVTWEDHYDAIRKAHTDEAYLDYVRRNDAEFGAQVVLSQRPGVFFGLAILRGQGVGRSNEAQRAVLAEAAPAVLAAIRMQDAIEHQGIELLRGSLDAIRSAAILLDGIGKVCGVTAAAQALLGPDSLQIRAATLHATRPDVDRELQARIGRALAGREDGAADLWLRSADAPLLLDVRSLPRQDWSFGTAPRAIVTLRTPLRPTAQQSAHLATALGLTLAEGEVVSLLVQGHSRQAVANLRGVSVQTVISQLRTIFQKCGVNREAVLVSMAREVIELASR
ncbi:helix-turn-helix transcriptional regulator [Novosphingobium sp. KA1]|uniref:helix-turn-helix transcriptional regulator n=1 Tax=Novosphingobium sp. (strain KA1) TaxID=164608 RepID=UPI001AF0C609|nr:helix-turn-helix transcriptional regulator [Novosphingobium sp. KA1]QSR16527.1 helix-turn-helix transcriptional regulator [Novosphingobium sp. KA1]